jgi:hypothetical protein
MSAWGNTDSPYSKPRLSKERNVRKSYTFVTANSTVAGASAIIFTAPTLATTPANIGVVAGMYVSVSSNTTYRDLLGANGVPGFFASNVVVSSVGTGFNGNTVTFTGGITTRAINAGETVVFDTRIPYVSNELANTYYADTILVTATRIVNANVVIANTHTGWSHVYRTVNNDGTVRFRKEVLIVTANAAASNISSGNTSSNGIYRGV